MMRTALCPLTITMVHKLLTLSVVEMGGDLIRSKTIRKKELDRRELSLQNRPIGQIIIS
jgi:hypothetical protein